MSKIDSLATVSNITGAPVAAENALNHNFQEITEAFQKTLSRDGSVPNEMQAVLDMNDYRIINLKDGANGQDAATVSQLQGLIASGAIDGDRGDIIISGGGSSMIIDDGVVGSAQLGEDITQAGKDLITSGNASVQRAVLGLGTAATEDITDFAASVHGHLAVDVTDFVSASQDAIKNYLVAGTGITLTPTPYPPGSLTITSFAGNLDSLSDVVLTAPQADDVLAYNGASWINRPQTYISDGGNF